MKLRKVRACLRPFMPMCSGAGTDANVTIALHGTKGFVGATRIENASNNFERGRKVRALWQKR